MLALLLIVAVAAHPELPQNDQELAQTARFALAQEAFSWDPLASDGTGNQVIQRQVYEGLFEYLPQAAPIATQPLLAESWQIQDGGLEWTIKLRQDAYFFDPIDPPIWPNRRHQLNADDLIFSWLRMADGRNPGTGFWAMQGLFAGIDEFHRATTPGAKPRPKPGGDTGSQTDPEQVWQEALRNGIEGLRKIDPFTIKLRLKHPDSKLMVRLASPYFVIYPQEAVQRSGAEFLNQPVGSGPYRYAGWIPKHQAVLESTPDWRGQNHPDGSSLPQISKIVFTTVLDDSTRALQFEKGEIDRITPTQASFDSLIKNDQPADTLKKRGVQLVKVPPAGLSMVAFNMDDADLGWIPGDIDGNLRRKHLRQAIALAFPYQRWHTVLRNGTWAQPALSFLPLGLPETPELPNCAYNQTDIPRAKEYLIRAGFPDGNGAPLLRYELAGTDPIDQASGEIFQEAMRQLGIKVEIVPNTWGELRAKMNRREAQVFGRAWTMDWADAVNLLALFYGPNQSPNINRSNFQHEKYDQLFEQLTFANTKDRIGVVREMLEVLNEELPAIPVDHRIGYLLVQPWLKGVSIHPFDPYACKFYRLER